LQTKQFLTQPVANTFKVVIQLGAILAAVIIYKDRFVRLLSVAQRNIDAQVRTRALKLTHVLVGLIPAGTLGMLFEDYVDAHLFSTPIVIGGLVCGAVLMLLADVFGTQAPRAQTVDQITYMQALGVGLFQCLSIWPGFSRSGSTIAGAVFLGMSHRAAADFTFIMAVPFILGASGVSLLKNWQYVTLEVLPFFVVGFVSAFVFALISIRFLLRLINTMKLTPFAVYRLVLAVIVYAVYF
jgi:undecaprenyl-diphosphatase